MNIKLLRIPENKPKGWDCADAVIEDSMDAGAVFNFIRSNLTDLPENLPEPPEKRQERTERKPTPEQAEAAMAPFRCLGHNHGEYYYLPSGTKQVCSLKVREHSKITLLGLAPIEYWEKIFPTKSGPDWGLAISTLFRICEKRGIYNTHRVRGLGVWVDNGRIVVHCGSHLIVDSVKTNIDSFESSFTYENSNEIEPAIGAPLTDSMSRELPEIIENLNFQDHLQSMLFSGWLVCACVCGALKWRPMIWLTGGRGCGKSWVLENIVRPLLGEFHLFVQSVTSAAGIRQYLGNNALPILFDEAEAESTQSSQKRQEVVELARQASSDTGGKILKGTVSGRVQEYIIRSSFLFASINSGIRFASDASRITKIELIDRSTLSQSHFEMLRRIVFRVLNKEYCNGFRARCFQNVNTVLKNAETLSGIIAEKMGSRRAGDQIGTMLAGYQLLISTKALSESEARSFVEGLDLNSVAEGTSISDEINCLNHILQSLIRIETDKKIVSRSISELIKIVIKKSSDFDVWSNDSDSDVLARDADRCLRRHGLALHDGRLHIADRHPELSAILKTTAWEHGWNNLLIRLPSAERDKNPYRFAGLRVTAVSIQIERFLDLGEGGVT